jgi:hypothetical protein
MPAVLQHLFASLAFVAALVLSAAGLQRMAPPLPVPEYAEKLAFFARHHKEIDTVFIGSSRVRRQISPKVFDATTAELGMPSRSFNFGLDGMGHPELPYVVDELLKLQPRGLREIVIELTRFGREFNRIFPPDSLRTIHWHTYRYTASTCRAVWQDPAGPRLMERLSRILQHLSVCAVRELNLGRGAAWCQAHLELPLPPAPARVALGPEGNGFFQVPDRFPPGKIPAYRSQLAEWASRRGAPVEQDPAFQSATREMLAKLHRRGIRITIVVMPRIFPQPPWVPEFAPGEGLVLRFDDLEKEAALYNPAARYDAQHLNAEGAKLFTRALAQRLVAARQGRTTPPGATSPPPPPTRPSPSAPAPRP